MHNDNDVFYKLKRNCTQNKENVRKTKLLPHVTLSSTACKSLNENSIIIYEFILTLVMITSKCYYVKCN